MRCAAPYLETTDLIERLRQLTPGLTDEDISTLEAVLTSPSNPPSPETGSGETGPSNPPPPKTGFGETGS